MSELMDEAVIRMPFDMAMEGELSRKQFYDRANALLSELTELRAKMAELESQEPAIRVSGGRVVDFSPNYQGYVNEGDFYAKPVPADKPARITDEMILSAMDVVIGYSGDYGTYNDYLSKEAAREVLEAALSVSEQVPAVAVPDSYITLVEQLITKVCCIAVERLNEVAPDYGWDSGEAVAGIYIRELQAMLSATPAPSHSQQSARPTDDELWDQTITERDTYHDWADKLANAISEYFGSDIGEHTSANNPWAEALEVIECADKPAEKLTAPARVGSTIFGVGVDTGAVIERAQREYEYRAALKSESAVAVRNIEACALICDQEAAEWDSDNVITEKNYAAACASRIRALLPAAPSHSQQSAESDLEIVQKALGKCRGDMSLAADGWVVYVPYVVDGVIAEGVTAESLLTWAKQTVTDRCPSHESEQGGNNV